MIEKTNLYRVGRYAALAIVIKLLLIVTVAVVGTGVLGFDVKELPIDGILLTIVAAGASILIYARRHRFPFTVVESLTFGMLISIVHILFGLAVIALEIILAGQKLTLESVGLVTFGAEHGFSGGEIVFVTLADLALAGIVPGGLSAFFAYQFSKDAKGDKSD